MDTFDTQLLDAWRRSRDREAMDQLIRRHIHFVYGAARRILRDSVWAEDVTQAVFMLLIQKSPRLPSDAAIAVWLHRTTRYACANARKMQARRERRDRRTATLESTQMENAIDHIDNADEREQLLPLLDEAITQLGERDRSGLILCYFQRRTFREIGAMLGTSEEAARKRVTRSVDRIREYFLSRGVAMLSAAPIVAALGHESSLVAPTTLVSATTKLATVTHLATLAYPSAQIAQKVMHTMLMWKVKLATAACAAIVAGSAVTATAIHQLGGATIAPAVVASSSVMLSAASDEFEAKASDKTTVRFLGVAKWGASGNDWFAIDGAKIDDPRGPFARDRFQPNPNTTHQAMLHIAGNNLDGGYSVSIPGCKSTLWDLTPDANSAYILVPFSAADDRAKVDLEVLVADGEWKTIATGQNEAGQGLGDFETEYGGVALTHLFEVPGRGSMLYVAHDISGPQVEVFAVDAQGVEHRCFNINSGQHGKFYTMRLEYDLAPDAIASVNVKVRPYNRKVTAKDVTLDPAKPTKPTIEVTEVSGK